MIDLMHLLNLIYIALILPFSVAFYEKVNGNTTFLVFEALSIAIQLMIIIVTFRTPVTYFGEHTLDFVQVFKIYARHGLILDVLGLLPLNLVFGYLGITAPSLLFISLIKLLRVFAALRLGELLEKFQIYLKNHSILIVVFHALLFLILLWHWTSCLWFFINRLEHDTFEVTWYKFFNLARRSTSQQYLLSIYYTIKIVTGVGQSDMIAYNDLERIVFVIFINIGDAVFAVAFGLIA